MGRGGDSGWEVIVGGRGRKKRKGGRRRGGVCLLTTTAADLTTFVHSRNNTQCVFSILKTRSSERRSSVLSRLGATDTVIDWEEGRSYAFVFNGMCCPSATKDETMMTMCDCGDGDDVDDV